MNRRKLFTLIAGASAAAVAAKAGMAIAAPAGEADIMLDTHGLGYMPMTMAQVLAGESGHEAILPLAQDMHGRVRIYRPNGEEFPNRASYHWPAPADSTALAAHLHAV